MPFRLEVPRADATPINILADTGQIFFVAGANGTGKSSLLQRFTSVHASQTRRISAHRQTWIDSDHINISAMDSRNIRNHIQSYDQNPISRFRDNSASQRANISLYDLIDSENVRARGIADAMTREDVEGAKVLATQKAPINKINDLLRLSNLPIQLAIESEQSRIVARRSGGPAYGIAQLSDGERNAILIGADILTAKSGSLLIIDEPERHLHRSIISPLLTALFAERPDCAFIISTHDMHLPFDHSNSQTLLIRGCTHDPAGNVVAWDADLLPRDTPIDDDLKLEILGARRKILFVEGNDSGSLDKPLYGLIFPSASIIAKSSCRLVEQCVTAIRSSTELHWLNAFGLIDNDNRDADDLVTLQASGIYALQVHSAESVYYHPDIQRAVAIRHEIITGENANELLGKAKERALTAISLHAERLARRAVEKSLRAQLMTKFPKEAEIVAGGVLNVEIDIGQALAVEIQILTDFISTRDLASIISRYPIRETPALTEIVRMLRFKDRDQYESAVRKMLIDEPDKIELVRNLFGTLADDLLNT